MGPPVEPQLAAHVWIIGLRRADVEVARQYERLVAVTLEMAHRGAPNELVAAEVVRWIEMTDRQNAHRRREHRLARVELAGTHETRPLVTVVVPSHGRPHGLSALLDALAEQTMSDRWELVVVHTYSRDEASRLLDAHDLAVAGVLRHIAIDPQTARPTYQRNLGWREARGELIAFTDDDCRPAPDWLGRLVETALEYPGAIVQGTTRPDPRDRAAFASPHIRTISVEAPGRDTQTCNILYERALLERIGGFDERFPAAAGEDIDLALRAQAAGAVLVGAPDAIVYHAVEALSLGAKIRHDRKWASLVFLVKRHPELRLRHCLLGLWWKREHLGAMLALAGVASAPRRPWGVLGVWAYSMTEPNRYRGTRAARRRALREMPAHWLVEMAEIGWFVTGSRRYRNLVP